MRWATFLLLWASVASLYGSSEPSCSTVKCRTKEKCQMDNGEPVCIPEFQSYCHGVGGLHYRTFDGHIYDFQGTCTYTVARSSGSDRDLKSFNIEAKNENRGNTRASYDNFVTIKVHNNSISLVRNENGLVRVNDQSRALPLSLNNGQVRLYQSGGSAVIETDFSLRVYYDWNSVLNISLSSSYYGSVCGLCGNFNGNASDDLTTSEGSLASNLVDFGKSWKVEDGDRFCSHSCNGECKTCPVETQRRYEANDTCGLISKPDGPFRLCHEVLDPKTYLDNCVYDFCINGGSKQILCQSLKTYAEACQKNNIQIQEWRSLSGCPKQCPAQSEDKLCSGACPETCDGDATPTDVSGSWTETCECKDGHVLQEGICKAGPVTAFMRNYSSDSSQANCQLKISSYSEATSVTVTISNSFRKVFDLNAWTTITVQLPGSAEIQETGKSNNVVFIQATNLISVLFINYEALSTATSIVHPTSDLGTEYYTVTPLKEPSNESKEFSVISSGIETIVDIYLKAAVTFNKKVHRAGSKLTVPFDDFSAVHLHSSGDLSGSKVVSQKPVVVLTGHKCALENTKCNHIREQLHPVSRWGTTFIVPPIYRHTKSGIAFVVASQPTKIDYQIDTETFSKDLGEGQVIQLDIPPETPIYINASVGIQVTYFLKGWQDSSATRYDHTLINIPSIDNYCSSYYIYGQQGFDNYGTVIVKSTDIAKVTANKSALTDMTWVGIPGTEYSWATQKLARGSDSLLVENLSSPFLLLSYGLSKTNSYVSPATCIGVTHKEYCKGTISENQT